MFDEKGELIERPYVFLHVNVLREYLEVELKEPNIPFPWDLERAIDDWVFLCFFVGNDFLPHLPSLEIREGAIDRLIEIWKRNLPVFGGYITDCGDIDLARVQILLMELGSVEDEIFIKRREEEERKRNNRKRRKEQERQQKEGMQARRAQDKYLNNPEVVAEAYAQLPTYSVKDFKNMNQANKAAAEALKKSLLGKKPQAEEKAAVPAKRKADENEDIDNGNVSALPPVPDQPVSETDVKVNAPPADDEMKGEPPADKEAPPADADEALADAPIITEESTADVVDEEEDEDDVVVVETLEVADVPIPIKMPAKDDDDSEPEDNVRLWESGWKKRYYEKKFHVEESDKAFIRE
jgi:5'-3' exoribonuclease 2